MKKEKKKHDREVEDVRQEISLLETAVKRWRWKLINQSYYSFKPGFEFLKARLSYLKYHDCVIKKFEYSSALQYLIRRYESMLRGKSGRPPNIGSFGRRSLEDVIKEMRP